MPSPMPLVEPVTSASFSTEEAAVVAAMIDIPAVPGTRYRTRYPPGYYNTHARIYFGAVRIALLLVAPGRPV